VAETFAQESCSPDKIQVNYVESLSSGFKGHQNEGTQVNEARNFQVTHMRNIPTQTHEPAKIHRKESQNTSTLNQKTSMPSQVLDRLDERTRACSRQSLSSSSTRSTNNSFVAHHERLECPSSASAGSSDARGLRGNAQCEPPCPETGEADVRQDPCWPDVRRSLGESSSGSNGSTSTTRSVEKLPIDV
jgi:hypothetical protein